MAIYYFRYYNYQVCIIRIFTLYMCRRATFCLLRYPYVIRVIRVSRVIRIVKFTKKMLRYDLPAERANSSGFTRGKACGALFRWLLVRRLYYKLMFIWRSDMKTVRWCSTWSLVYEDCYLALYMQTVMWCDMRDCTWNFKSYNTRNNPNNSNTYFLF